MRILNALPFRGAGASLPTLIFMYFEHPTLPPSLTIQSQDLSANAGADAAASGPKDERTWEQTRTHLGADTLERGMVFANRHRSRIGGMRFFLLADNQNFHLPIRFAYGNPHRQNVRAKTSKKITSCLILNFAVRPTSSSAKTRSSRLVTWHCDMVQKKC